MPQLGVVFRNHAAHGFTLTELLVSMAIMSMIMGITLSGGPATIMRLSLADNTYKAELLIREAQLQGSSINSVNNIYGGSGVYFDRTLPDQIIKFKDRVDSTIVRAIGIGNGKYDTLPIDEKEITMMMTNNHRVGKLCVALDLNSFSCNTDGLFSVPSIDTLTISFTRPKQTAHIYINGDTTVDYSSACIQFDSTKSPLPGYVKSILIYKSGMITKNQKTCN